MPKNGITEMPDSQDRIERDFSFKAHTTVSLREDEWNRLPSMPSIDFEIRVQGEDRCVPVAFRHSHQTSVGERHRHAMIASQQLGDGGKFRGEIEFWDDKPTFQKRQKLFAASLSLSQEEKSLAQGCVASSQRRMKTAKHFLRPPVMLIVPLQIRHQRLGIRDDSLMSHSPANAAYSRLNRAPAAHATA